MDAEKLAALEAMLLQEKERRFNEKFANAEFVVVGIPEEAENAPPGALVIVTGVPDGGLDDGDAPTPEDKAPGIEDFGARERVTEMLSAVAKPMPTTLPPASASTEPEEGPHSIHVQIRGADPDKGDPGQMVEGSFTISSSGIVRVKDDQGQLLGTHTLQPMEDAVGVARRILREKKGREPFWNPIPYRVH